MKWINQSNLLKKFAMVQTYSMKLSTMFGSTFIQTTEKVPCRLVLHHYRITLSNQHNPEFASQQND